MWWVQEPGRFKNEIAGIDALRESGAWLSSATPRLQGLNVAIDFDIIVGGQTYPLTLEYPAFFPITPPIVTPRDGARLSGHQYGAGGELCLEHRADNWDPSITGTQMIESTYRLLSGERPGGDERGVVASAHSTTLGQRLRGSKYRYLLTADFWAYIQEMPAQFCLGTVVVAPTAGGVNVAHFAEAGSDTGTAWREFRIPTAGRGSYKAIVIKLPLPDGIPRPLEAPYLQDMVRQTAGEFVFSTLEADIAGYVVIAIEGETAGAYHILRTQENRFAFPYTTLDLRDDATNRISTDYLDLPKRRVAIIGCGSLGAKIASSLARSGVGDFLLVDDDILMPGNIVRHDLDGNMIGAHKVDALELRLKALFPAVQVTVRRVSLGGQEAAGTIASVLEGLAASDLLIDATADPTAFNYVGSVAATAKKPMIWAEVYAGGIGGFVARIRPGLEPGPHVARNQYLTWCRDQGVPWEHTATDYAMAREGDPPMVADDAEVSVIAAHATRLVLDVLVRPTSTLFPHPAYVIGFAEKWIFREPFDVRPIDFIGIDGWGARLSSDTSKEAVDYMLAVVEGIQRAS